MGANCVILLPAEQIAIGKSCYKEWKFQALKKAPPPPHHQLILGWKFGHEWLPTQTRHDIGSFKVLRVSTDDFKIKCNSTKWLFPLKSFHCGFFFLNNSALRPAAFLWCLFSSILMTLLSLEKNVWKDTGYSWKCWPNFSKIYPERPLGERSKTLDSFMVWGESWVRTLSLFTGWKVSYVDTKQ